MRLGAHDTCVIAKLTAAFYIGSDDRPQLADGLPAYP
jgi:hypothetical protein